MDKPRGFEELGLFSTRCKVFIVVAENSSISEAASILGMNQSTVSYHLQSLEKMLNVSLLDHSKRPAKLTAEGKVLYEEIRFQYSNFQHSLKKIQARNFIKPVLRLGIIESLSRNLGVKLIKELSPLVSQITLMTGTSERLVNSVRNQELDLVIASTKKIDETFLASRTLFNEPSVLALPQEPKFTNKTSFSWEELKFCGLPFLRYNRFSGGSEMTESFFNSLYMHLPNRVEVDDGGVMLELIAQRVGWSLLRPATLIQYPELAKKIHICKMPPPLLQRHVNLIFRKNEFPDFVDKVRTISIRFFKDQFELEIDNILRQTGHQCAENL